MYEELIQTPARGRRVQRMKHNLKEIQEKVREYYPQAMETKGRFWRVHRDPSEPFSGIYVGSGVTRRDAWAKALKNIQRGPQCCFPHPLNYVVCDEAGNTLEIEVCAKQRVMINVIEHPPKGEERTSQAIITGNMEKIAEIRNALNRILDSR